MNSHSTQKKKDDRRRQALPGGARHTKKLKNKNPLDANYYFIVLLIGSTCFGHYYAHHQDCNVDYHIGHFFLGLL